MFLLFVNCIINKSKTNRYNTKRIQKLVLGLFFHKFTSLPAQPVLMVNGTTWLAVLNGGSNPVVVKVHRSST